MEAMFIQGMYSCNYRHDVMITGNPCPVEMQAEKGTHGAICQLPPTSSLLCCGEVQEVKSPPRRAGAISTHLCPPCPGQ